MLRAGAERQSKSRWQEIKYCSSTETGRRETSKHGDSWKKKRQLKIVTVGKCRRKEVLGVFRVVWKKRKSVRLVLFEMNVSETKQKEENERNQKLSWNKTLPLSSPLKFWWGGGNRPSPKASHRSGRNEVLNFENSEVWIPRHPLLPSLFLRRSLVLTSRKTAWSCLGLDETDEFEGEFF